MERSRPLGAAMVFHATVIFLFIGVVASASLSTTPTSDQEFFDTIPETEKPHFVSYSLVLVVYAEDDVINSTDTGDTEIITKQKSVHIPKDVHIPDDLWHKFQSMYIPDAFPHKLFNWLCTDYKMDKPAVEELLLRTIYCFPDGSCIDLDDVGNTCCPF